MSTMTGDLSGQVPIVLIMLGIFSFVGIIGNLLVIIVYSLKQDRLTATLFILVLAVTDFLACLTLIPSTMTIEYLEWRISSNILCKSYYLLNNSFIPFSSLLISSIAFDRYFCLCHPFAKIMTLSRAKRVIATLVALCVALGVSATFGVRVMKTNMNSISMNTSAIHNQMASPMDTYECTEVIRVNSTGLETTVFLIVQKSQIVSYILCIISVAVLYILIYRSVSRVFKRREQLKGNHKVCKQKSKMKEGKVNGITPNAQICSADSKLIETTKLSELKSHKSEGPEESKDAKLNLPAGEDSAARENDICDSSIQIFERLTVKAPVLHPLSTDAIKTKGKSKLMTLGRKRSGSRSEINVDLVSRLNTRTEDTEPTKSRVVLSRTKHLSRHYKDSPAFHNLKTAAMLFVVAILYIVTFLPAMLMVNELISLNLPIFYLYYANNAMNPVIYGFMNPNFRADIRQLFLRKRCSYGKGRSAGSLPRRPSVR